MNTAAWLLALALWNGSLAAAPTSSEKTRSVRFKTADGWTIAALYHAPPQGGMIAILIHGLASGKEEWNDFAPKLWRMGMGSLAIDLRAHGQSRTAAGAKMDPFVLAKSGQLPSATQDILAAAAFLRRKGIPSSRVAIMGASIGANLATQATIRLKSTPWLVLLSPGANYGGVGLALPKGMEILVAASPADAYAYNTCSLLAQAPGGPLFLTAVSGHGVQMFADPVFTADLIKWISRRVRR